MNARRLRALRPMTRAKILPDDSAPPPAGGARQRGVAAPGFPLCVFARPALPFRREVTRPPFLRRVRGRRRTHAGRLVRRAHGGAVSTAVRREDGAVARWPTARHAALPGRAHHAQSDCPRPRRGGSNWPSGTSSVARRKPANPASCRHAVPCAAPWTPANATHDCARPWGALKATPATKPSDGNFSNCPAPPAACVCAPRTNWPAGPSPRCAAPRHRRKKGEAAAALDARLDPATDENTEAAVK